MIAHRYQLSSLVDHLDCSPALHPPHPHPPKLAHQRPNSPTLLVVVVGPTVVGPMNLSLQILTPSVLGKRTVQAPSRHPTRLPSHPPSPSSYTTQLTQHQERAQKYTHFHTLEAACPIAWGTNITSFEYCQWSQTVTLNCPCSMAIFLQNSCYPHLYHYLGCFITLT